MQLFACMKGGVSGRDSPVRGGLLIQRCLIVEIDPLICLSKNTRRKGPTKETAESHLLVVLVKPSISPQSSNKQYTEQPLTKVEAKGGKDTKCRVTYYLEVASIIQ